MGWMKADSPPGSHVPDTTPDGWCLTHKKVGKGPCGRCLDREKEAQDSIDAYTAKMDEVATKFAADFAVAPLLSDPQFTGRNVVVSVETNGRWKQSFFDAHKWAAKNPGYRVVRHPVSGTECVVCEPVSRFTDHELERA